MFVLATSNFKEAIDPAFISRVDIHFETGRPGLSATYRIMTEVIEELMRLHFIEHVFIFVTDYRSTWQAMKLVFCRKVKKEV